MGHGRISRRTVVGAGAGAVTLAAAPRPAAGAGRAGRQEPTPAADQDVHDELLGRWREVLVGGAVPADATDYATAVAAQDRTAQRHLASLRTDPGRTTPWDDLPLGSASANVTSVANRLRTIALCCATPASTLHGDQDAARAVAAGLGVLHASAYRAGQESYGNWWDWEIGTSKSVGDSAVLLGAALPAGTRDGLLAAIDHFVPDPRRMLRDTLESTGANRVDLCRAVAVRGALGRDPERLRLASTSLTGVLDPVLVGDGFHPDGSFVMHTCVAYPGTYGEVLVRGMAELMRLLAGTEWDVAAHERERTVAAVRDTFLPLVHGGLMADSVRGRAIARTTARDADDGFLLTVDLVSLAGALPPAQAETALRLRAVARDWLRRNTWRPLSSRQPVQIATVAAVLADDTLPDAPGLHGHFAYPDMERFVHRRPGWSCSLALNSDRIARYEYMNGENAKGWHTGDGMLQLHLDTDLFHYTEDYWPTVDAKRLPGTTVDTAPLPVGAGGDNDHQPLTGTRWSGGVRLDDVGFASVDLRGTDSPLRARKSWLFLDDAVLCAGSGIRSGPGRGVETVVENRRTDARLTIDGQAPTGPSAPARWAHLAGVGGYVFLSHPPELHALREERTGRWRDLHATGPTTPLTQPYTTLWLDHGADPDDAAYAYLQLPGASFAATAARASYPGVRVTALTPELHAFSSLPGHGPRLTAITFFAPGTHDGITVDAPCSVLLTEEPGTALRVAVADPSRSAATVTVELDRHRSVFPAVTSADEGLHVLDTSPLRLLAEPGARHGASLRAELRPGRPPRRQHARTLVAAADATVRGGVHADDNAGTGPLLTVWTAETADDTHRAYLAFDLSTVRSRVHRAVLWLYGSIPNDPATRADDLLATGLRAYAVPPGSWTESDLTWRTAPPPGAALGTGQATVYPDWIALEVTGAVTARPGDRLDLALAQQDPGHRVLLHGRENPVHPPLLELITD
ncbi:hypothetical protein AQ490_09755 [Wenjunlia vitaminophila]|uniref:Hyaluronate lyase n=1 Tax=Wenjunlia vitaminophila TaxID=76728 RepID=A0A0T6LLZ6_WENVI|nr:polysaccharide lyase family 8 super-sandwich domain-containing protein [Wenjunlia vitaminophila]KRV47032.1 hypothetical protein AQ490_09755 [Wenjunlia vitaminophila]